MLDDDSIGLSVDGMDGMEAEESGGGDDMAEILAAVKDRMEKKVVERQKKVEKDFERLVAALGETAQEHLSGQQRVLDELMNANARKMDALLEERTEIIKQIKAEAEKYKVRPGNLFAIENEKLLRYIKYIKAKQESLLRTCLRSVQQHVKIDQELAITLATYQVFDPVENGKGAAAKPVDAQGNPKSSKRKR